MSKNTGFTLIELMIVVAIIGIMSVMAVPTFHQYVVRTQVTEALELTESIKKAVTGYYTAQKQFPADNQAAGVPLPEHLIGNFTSRVEVENGAIHITLGNRINARLENKILTLRPVYVTANTTSPISWVCGYAEAADGMTAQGENRTNVSPFYLSIKCRAWKS
jgi:type IV pilus assembly protein PilA